MEAFRELHITKVRNWFSFLSGMLVSRAEQSRIFQPGKGDFQQSVLGFKTL